MTYCRDLWLFLVAGMQILRGPVGISAAENPCPDIFQYEGNPGSEYGIITVPNPSPYLAIEITVEIYITAPVPRVITWLVTYKMPTLISAKTQYSFFLSCMYIVKMEIKYIFNVRVSVHRNNILVYNSGIYNKISRQQYGVMVTRCCSYSCFVLLKMGESDARNM